MAQKRLEDELAEKLYNRLTKEINDRVTGLKQMALSPANHKDAEEIRRAIIRMQTRPMRRKNLKPHAGNHTVRDSKKAHMQRLQELLEDFFFSPRAGLSERVLEGAEFLKHALETEIDYLEWMEAAPGPRRRMGARGRGVRGMEAA